MLEYTYMRFAPLGNPDSLASELMRTNDSSACPNGTQWLWTVLGDCAVTTRQQISAYCGLVSMLTWIWVMTPQIFKNMRNIDGMAGVSFFLIFQWTGGDTTNLIGSILTKQLKPQIYLACYFVLTDVVLLIEYLVFFIRKRKKRRNDSDRVVNSASRAVLCLMGLASLTHGFKGILTPSTSNFESRIGHAQPGHLSRFLLSEQSRSDLLFTPENHSEFDRFANLVSSQGASTSFWHNTTDIIGYVIGCISSIFYLGSRTAQILKNYKSQSTDGLAVLTFILAVFGNITYGGQILIQSVDGEFLLEHTPWIIGSLGVIGLDCTLIWQFHYYGKMKKHHDEARQALINHENCVINVEPPNSIQASGSNGNFNDSLY